MLALLLLTVLAICTGTTLAAVADVEPAVQQVPGPGEPKIALFKNFRLDTNNRTLSDSSPDITRRYPPGNPRGLSSFIVEGGIWCLYTEINFGGTKIAIDGVSEFGPGSYALRGRLNDLVQSIQLLDPPPLITLFTHFNMDNVNPPQLSESHVDIGEDFPPMRREGLSAFIVTRGRWSLYTQANFQGDLVKIRGETVFKEGTYVLDGRVIGRFNDQTVSIELVG